MGKIAPVYKFKNPNAAVVAGLQDILTGFEVGMKENGYYSGSFHSGDHFTATVFCHFFIFLRRGF
jgi:hypothetical protein